MLPAEEALSLPNRAAEPSPVGFPVIASVAPLLAAGVIWAITGSAFTLVFAVLSPVIAVASMLDGRRTNRNRRRSDAAAHGRAVDALRAAVTERHDALHRAAWRRTPSAGSILPVPGDAGRWRQTDGAIVGLGRGRVASGIRLAGVATDERERALRDWAATLADAPITADARHGIGLVGPPALVRAMARAVLVQLCFALAPDGCGLAELPPGWSWAARLPHAEARTPTQGIVVIEAQPGTGARVRPGPDTTSAPTGRNGARLVIATAARVDDLPPGCATVVRVHGPQRAEILESPDHAWGHEFRPELVGAQEAGGFAGLLREHALAAGLLGAGRALPRVVARGDLPDPLGRGPGEPGAPLGLDCVIGLSEAGAVSVDLVRDGPHAVVGGTTGSGKSELLLTWVTSMAAAYTPGQVVFLLVDFKGGAAFRPLRDVPHCVGLITDLDPRQAARALASLAAELRFRERALGDAGAREVTEIGGAAALPRLVIVVDEFATMLDAFPELHALFVDVAARGRSLGVHLILCTQRPVGVVRDSLLANCSLRLSLRVNNRADSEAVIGTDAAAALPADVPGRCLVARSTGDPVLCQVATTEEHDIRAIVGAVAPGPAPRRPWLDPLPHLVTDGDLDAIGPIEVAHTEVAHTEVADTDTTDGPLPAARGFRLGLVDEPDRQRYRVARYDPLADGHLLVVGGPRSGKSTLLATLAAQAQARAQARRPSADARVAGVEPGVELIAADVETTWDALERARRVLEAGSLVGDESPMLLLDDFDSVCARWDPDHRLAALDILTYLVRDGQGAGLRVVLAAQRLTGPLQGLPALCRSTLLLRLPDRQEHLAAGGAAALFDAALPPGGGTWRGSRIQLLRPDPGRGEAPPARDATPILEFGRPLLVVSGAPVRTAEALRRALGGHGRVVDVTGSIAPAPDRLELVEGTVGTVFVGDADSWQSQWMLLGGLRTRAAIVFDGCGLADYRLIARRRDLPPPLAPGRGHVWVLNPDGAVTRAVFPPPGRASTPAAIHSGPGRGDG